MQDLKLIPFSDKEMESEYSTTTFNERGIEFTLLRNVSNQKPSSGNIYKFGVVSDDYEFFWFFGGKPIIKGRIKALETYYALSIYCKKRSVGTPFAYKVNK